jgi:hypothetical protein
VRPAEHEANSKLERSSKAAGRQQAREVTPENTKSNEDVVVPGTPARARLAGESHEVLLVVSV